MNSIVSIVIFVVIFGGVVAYIIVSAIRRREIQFEGSVIDKNIIENRQMNNGMNRGPGITLGNNMNGNNMNGGVTHEYKIRVKTDQGKEVNYKVSEGMYETIKIGDRVSKPHGTTEITIVSSTPSPTAQPVPAASVASAVAAVPPTPPVATTPPPVDPTQNTPPSS